MRLRSLQIKGFKSFANDTVLNFDEDVIGVVGPNGSGKSNIVDAIRWVLGEQKSKELRLETMTDVIFNGTKTRKEAGVAQVSLTFDNTKNILPTEYNSVSVSRLLYRSGESEYRLNNVTCRLKDIRSLFIDTGIGSNSYAIIALGMVDDILDDKDNARRKMFEQAAGISKYKTRKRETLNKLKNTDADLNRIEDLLFEIESNLKSLEKQAKRTKKYFEIKEEYKELSIQYSLRSVSTLKNQYKEVGEVLSKQENDYRNQDVDLKNEEAQLEKIKANNLSNEQNVSESQRGLNALVNKLRLDENEKNLSSQRLEFKNEEVKKITQNLDRILTELVSTKKNIQTVEERLFIEKGKLEHLNQEVESAKTVFENKKNDYSKVRSELDSYTRLKQDLQTKIFEIEKNIAVLQNTYENTIKEIQQIENKQKDLTSNKKELEKEYNYLLKEVTEKENILNLKEDAISKKRGEVEKTEVDIKSQKDALSKLFRKKDAFQNEYDLLKSMVDSYEGFPASIKYLSTKWKRKAPIFSDLIEVREEYKSIIEQYLEPFLNYYVVENIKEAQEAIRLLTETQKGKASFFLLDKFKEKKKKIEEIPESFPAATVLNTENKYLPLISTLLHSVYIYDGNPNNIEHLDQYKDSIFLASNGTFIKDRKSIKGGSVGLFGGKRIGRKKNLEKLAKELLKLEDNIIIKQTAISKNEEKISFTKDDISSSDLNVLKNDLKNLNQKLLKSKLSIDNITNTETSIKQNYTGLIHRSETSEISLKVLEKQQTNARKELSGLSNGKLFTDEEINNLDFKVSAAREKYNHLNIEGIKQKNLVDNFTKDLEVLNNKQRDQESRIVQYKKIIEEDGKLIVELEKKIHQLKSSLEAQYEKRDQQRKNLSEVEKLYYNARTIISEKEDTIRLKNRALNQLQVKINQLKDDFNDVKFKLTGVGERLKIEFEIVLNDIINDTYDDTLDYDVLEDKVSRLRNRINNFGEINPMALTAYEEMKERYDTIQQQRSDIIEARTTLLQTIKEIETTATTQFMESFDKVRENFIEVFRSLFTEDDTCDLVLLDAEDPLESAIEIIAKPKGKKPKSLSQLSGGEKTLTATALLFALYLLKPAPFCIFDEVDAPLDDANIQKFNKIIKRFSGDSQFIIVTHNKSTMSAVDVLYGVYMQEQGVSAVTPVDFRSYDYQPMMEVVNN